LSKSGWRRLRQAHIAAPLAAQLNVEFDGFDFHSDRASFESDRRRDAKLGAHGYRVLRFTGLQLRDEPFVVVARIAQSLGGASPPQVS
jgi:very-short-patch-repair endonuclease